MKTGMLKKLALAGVSAAALMMTASHYAVAQSSPSAPDSASSAAPAEAPAEKTTSSSDKPAAAAPAAPVEEKTVNTVPVQEAAPPPAEKALPAEDKIAAPSAPPPDTVEDVIVKAAATPKENITAPEKSARQSPLQLTLAEAVAVGVVGNPEYKVVADNRRATDEELNQAHSLYFPSIDVRADGGYEHSDDPATHAGPVNEADVENMWRWDTGVTLTQMLFDGWETKYENVRQQARVLSASHRVREASELTGLAVVESYLDVMRQRELLNIARQNVAEHVKIMEQIEDSASAGRSTEADMEQAKARLSAARAQEASVRESLRVAEASYIRDVGDPPHDLVMPLVPVDALEKDIEEEVKISLHQSPTIDIFEADINVAHAEYEGTKSVFYPQFDLQLNARDGYNLGGVEGRDKSAAALVVMNWNLYRGGGDTARVREHINREAQAKESRAKAARGIESDVRQTWARMVSAGERARQFAAQADANTEVVKAYKDQFDLNRRTLLDVLDAQNEWFVSRANTINAEYLEMFAVYRLLALKGELLPTLAVAYPRESDSAKM